MEANVTKHAVDYSNYNLLDCDTKEASLYPSDHV